MTKFNLLTINLHMFDGGAAAGGADGGAGAAASGTVSAKGETKGAVPGDAVRGTSGETSSAAVQSHAAGENKEADASNTLEARRKAFRDMIKGDYKAEYTEEVQKIIDRRFGETRNLENQIQAQQPIMEMLMQRYNISDGDPKKLLNAIENDDTYWTDAADNAGMSVEQYKQFQKLQRENVAFRRAQVQHQAEERAQRQVAKWNEEAEACKAKYPKFDFKAELEDPNFVAMLKAGTPVEHAYKVKYIDDILADARQTTAAVTEQRVADNIRARGSRPAENGTASQSAFVTKSKVADLSKSEIEEIARKAMRGEPVSFR